MIPVSMAKKSDRVVIEPFNAIPCDCYVVSGSSLVNEAVVTGESLPRAKNVGDFLLAGTRNGRGKLEAIVHENEQGSFLAQMLNSVEGALESKVRLQDNIDVIVRYFVVAVLVVAIVGSILFLRKLDTDASLMMRINAVGRHAMTILAVSCPCALGLSTPCAISAGVGMSSQCPLPYILFENGC